MSSTKSSFDVLWI